MPCKPQAGLLRGEPFAHPRPALLQTPSIEHLVEVFQMEAAGDLQ